MITTRYTIDSNSSNYRQKKNISFRKFTYDEKQQWTDCKISHDKDKFIELAQAALEQAKMEEEQKGVLQELVEVLLVHTGAPRMADVISEQFRSQDVIERLAEEHFVQEQHRRKSSLSYSPLVLKEPILNNSSIIPTATTTTIVDGISISEYLWRLFRLLLLACVVGLVYHFIFIQ